MGLDHTDGARGLASPERLERCERVGVSERLDTGWQLLESPANAFASPDELPADAQWLEAQVPGTVAGALRAAGRWQADAPRVLHDNDYWYRLRFDGPGPARLSFQGLATCARVWLNGVRLLDSENMFVGHDREVLLDDHNQLDLCFRSLHASLKGRRGRSRWRVRLATPATVRFVRTTLLGHMPGWCLPVHAVGPWRPIGLTRARPMQLSVSAAQQAWLDALQIVALGTRLDGTTGVVTLRVRTDRAWPGTHAGAAGPMLWCAGSGALLEADGADTLAAELQVPDVPLWWPHTHGEPTLHPLTLGVASARSAMAPTMLETTRGTTQGTTQAMSADPAARELGRVGFRRVTIERGADGLGFTPLVNGVAVFCRGACWTSADLVTLAGERADHAPWLELARAAGMNMLRIGGTMIYESDAFYQLCDELGLLVWQDFMFSNFDYPADDPAFIASVSDEASQFLARTARHVSLAVICGGSEVEQQAAMLGLAEQESLHTLFARTLPEIAAALRPDLHYVRNSPTGGALPFATNAGVSHYYGVGAYQRPLEDARRAGVRFASECLAFANVPEDKAVLDDLGAAPLHHPRWKQGVPRDPSAPWDFDDVRDFYLAALYGVDPPKLRYENPERYLDLSRAVTGEVMSEVFSEWRRAGSSCAGGLVWQFQDLRPGAGWGLVDVRRRPKAAWHALRQVWQPLQVLLTDEGLNGLQLHLINESQATRRVRLDLHCLHDGATSVAAASREFDLSAHATLGLPAAELLGRFFDFTYAYRFGPRAHDATVVSLTCPDTGDLLSQACHFPERRIVQRADLALRASVQSLAGEWWLELVSARLARWVHIVDPDFIADDDWFHLAPGRTRRVRLTARHPEAHAPAGEVRALNAFQPVIYQGVDERN